MINALADEAIASQLYCDSSSPSKQTIPCISTSSIQLEMG